MTRALQVDAAGGLFAAGGFAGTTNKTIVPQAGVDLVEHLFAFAIGGLEAVRDDAGHD